MKFLTRDHCVPCRVMCFAMCFAGNPIRWQIDHFRCIETHQTFDSLGVCWMQMSVNDFWAEDYWWACRVHTAQHGLFDSWFIQSTWTKWPKSFAICNWKFLKLAFLGSYGARMFNLWAWVDRGASLWVKLMSMLRTYCTAWALWVMIHSEYTQNGFKNLLNSHLNCL